MRTNTAPDIVIRQSAAVTFCKPKTQERNEILMDIERYLANGGKIESLKSPVFDPYPISTRRQDPEIAERHRKRMADKSRRVQYKMLRKSDVMEMLGYGSNSTAHEHFDADCKAGLIPPPDEIRPSGNQKSFRFWKHETIKKLSKRGAL